jgi:hypothetical protein
MFVVLSEELCFNEDPVFIVQDAHFYKWPKSIKSSKFKLNCFTGKPQYGIHNITLWWFVIGKLKFPPTFVTHSEPCIDVYTPTVTDSCIINIKLQLMCSQEISNFTLS